MTETALAELLSRICPGWTWWRRSSTACTSPSRACRRVGDRIQGTKHPLALVEGSTENATLVCGLLVDRGSGGDVTRPMLVGIDGSKALRKAVLDVLDRPVIQRCQLHKIKNVKDHLPQRLRSSVGRKMTDAYHASSALEAEATLLALARNWTEPIPGRRPACVRASTRRSRRCASACHRRWRGRCARPTPSSR